MDGCSRPSPNCARAASSASYGPVVATAVGRESYLLVTWMWRCGAETLQGWGLNNLVVEVMPFVVPFLSLSCFLFLFFFFSLSLYMCICYKTYTYLYDVTHTIYIYIHVYAYSSMHMLTHGHMRTHEHVSADVHIIDWTWVNLPKGLPGSLTRSLVFRRFRFLLRQRSTSSLLKRYSRWMDNQYEILCSWLHWNNLKQGMAMHLQTTTVAGRHFAGTVEWTLAKLLMGSSRGSVCDLSLGPVVFSFCLIKMIAS